MIRIHASREVERWRQARIATTLRPAWLVLAMALLWPNHLFAAPCETLARLALPHTTIHLAETVSTGRFAPPGGGAALDGLPSFCRISATARPSADSNIRIEVWLPSSGWNGEFQPASNGGWGGLLSFDAMKPILAQGYATATNDTGHEGDFSSAAFAIGHPEKLVDFGHRAFHEMTTTAKALIQAFYEKPPELSIMSACGGGSRQALASAQRYPSDYDALGVVGFDGYKTQMHFSQLWAHEATHREPGGFIPREKYALVHDAVLAACDARVDRVRDGLIEDAGSCSFDPGVLECKAGDAANCLTAPQVRAARMLYTPVTNPRTGEVIYSKLYPGSELGWGTLAGRQDPFPNAMELMRSVVFEDPKWQYRPIDYDRDLARALQPEKAVINADNPNLGPFFADGGKMLMVESWADATIAPGAAIDYYERVIKTVGDTPRTRDSIRLFMVPGMAHCPGSDGPENMTVDHFQVLRQWQETGRPPDQIVTTRYVNGKETGKRLVCAYPRVAVYRGSGDAADPANFSCMAPQ